MVVAGAVEPDVVPDVVPVDVPDDSSEFASVVSVASLSSPDCVPVAVVPVVPPVAPEIDPLTVEPLLPQSDWAQYEVGWTPSGCWAWYRTNCPWFENGLMPAGGSQLTLFDVPEVVPLVVVPPVGAGPEPVVVDVVDVGSVVDVVVPSVVEVVEPLVVVDVVESTVVGGAVPSVGDVAVVTAAAATPPADRTPTAARAVNLVLAILRIKVLLRGVRRGLPWEWMAAAMAATVRSSPVGGRAAAAAASRSERATSR